VSARQTRSGGIRWGRDRRSGGPLGIAVAVLFMIFWISGVTYSLRRDWNIALHGIHTTGTVAVAGACWGGDSNESALVDYVDRAGVQHQVSARSCENGDPKGSPVGLRYLTNDPSQIVTDDDAADLASTTRNMALGTGAFIVFLGLFIWFWARSRQRG
jgi:hypothetical protein